MIYKNIKTLDRFEIDLLLDTIWRCYGYDFRHYDRNYLKRRIENRLRISQLQYISEMIPKIIHDEEFLNSFLEDVSITVTEIFRDPGFYRAIREVVIPQLKKIPFIKVWHAGCATGEEVYSMAILLDEANLLEKTQIYATDFNNYSLQIAQRGIYDLASMQNFTKNYHLAGGTEPFSKYYYASYNCAKIKDFLKKNIVFSHHNLTTDFAFGEMNLVLCRNVLIYFDHVLQNRVLQLFNRSLINNGFLCLGYQENLDFTDITTEFTHITENEKIYVKNSK